MPFFQYNAAGLLGIDSTTPTTMGTALADLPMINFISFSASINALTVAEISITSGNNCVLFTTGSTICWGANTNGALGLDTPAEPAGDDPGDMAALVPLTFAASVKATISQISAGDRSSCGNWKYIF